MKDKKLTILATVPSGFCFGLQHITIDFFSSFPETVHPHFLITKWNDGKFSEMLDKEKLSYSYSWLGMFSRKMDRRNIKMSLHGLIKLPRLYYDFLKLQRKLKPDILYFANHHELILLYPVLFFCKAKVVCHMHDPPPVIPFQKKNFKFYSKVVDHFIAISESVRQRTILLGCAPEKITTIYNGINIPQQINDSRLNDICKQAGWPLTAKIIGITGQMTETKGAMDLLEAFKIVYANNDNARLLIGGKQMQPLYDQLKEKIAAYALDSSVFFTGWLPDVATFFNNVDIFVLASRHEEGYGLVVAEAMSRAVPVVITNSGGAVEIVEDHISGYIVEKRNPAQMAEQLSILVNDNLHSKQMGIAGRIRIQQYFDIKKQGIKLVEFLFNIVKN